MKRALVRAKNKTVTRGEFNALVKEETIVDIFNKHGAKLVDAHGALLRANVSQTNRFKEVPEDVVIIFLSAFGQCMSISAGRALGNLYFRSKKGLREFFRGEGGKAELHHGEILSRTRFPGQKYPDVSLHFFDARIPSMGFVWRLPLQYDRTTNISKLNVNIPPRTNLIYNNIPRHQNANTRLSEVISRLGKGVYIVSSCLVPSNQAAFNIGKLPYNLPKYYKGQRRGVLMTRGAKPYKKLIWGPKSVRPGTARRTAMPWYPPGVRKTGRYILTKEVLTALSRKPNLNLNEKFKLMRVNAPKDRLRKVQAILKNNANFVSKLNANSRRQWNSLGPYNKGQFIMNRLNRTGGAGNYYFQAVANNTNKTEYWYNGSTGNQINKPPANRMTRVNWPNSNNVNAFLNLVSGNNNAGLTWTAWLKK